MNFSDLPQPRPLPFSGHLQRWGSSPLSLIEEGAALGQLFGLQLGLRTVVGYSPAWNKRLLSDLTTFRSAGSFSAVVPYLSGGVILTDAPGHGPRRQTMNPGFGKKHLELLQARIVSALEQHNRQALSAPEFDALAWADGAVLAMLNAAYFSGEFPQELMHAFLAPLRQPFPTPAWPRPLLFARFDAELRRLAGRRLREGGDDLLSLLARLPGGVREARISLAAGHDTTTHTLAWATWFLAGHPEWQAPEHHRAVIKETLRLYPPGWMGSRRLAHDTEFGGVTLPKGALALYSPYLSGRDPLLWERAAEFWPLRWQAGFKPPAWAYLPFGGGERLCLGMHLANLMLETALGSLPPLSAVRGDPTPRPGVTLGPAGPLRVRARDEGPPTSRGGGCDIRTVEDIT
ncbi:beta-carotene 2-hydroxylase CYP287A1 [Deinococcus rubellus]|uniref:Cytochrome P450 n=1 Tax=Deinococcus rubellus TaxID=1889240 RepID=A0ABY5YG87_9DEIO|nr:cytochrome P450 [Deinococcus rubellus]UWX64067.1 cytochrome P450 [Deinococcus rubellus]